MPVTGDAERFPVVKGQAVTLIPGSQSMPVPARLARRAGDQRLHDPGKRSAAAGDVCCRMVTMQAL